MTDATPSDLQLGNALCIFAENEDDLDDGYATFIAIFLDEIISSEEEFESFLWARLQSLHDADQSAWAPGVNSDPIDPSFRTESPHYQIKF